MAKTDSGKRPDIIVDFNCDKGLLTICLKNIGGRSAYRVRTQFDKEFHGLSGEKCISGMRLFRGVDFVPPGKEFQQFVDVLANYAKRKEPMRLRATVTYRDRDGNHYEESMVHDLRIYLELGQANISKKPIEVNHGAG
jgi:hypothetical protein